MPKKVIITHPNLEKDIGGVAGFINSILPHFNRKNFDILSMDIGRSSNRLNFCHYFVDQLRFIRKIKKIKNAIVHINPSFNIKSFFRDGLFIYWAKLYNIPVISFIHGWRFDFEKKIDTIFKLFFNLTYAKVDVFIVLSKHNKIALRKWGIVAPIHILTTAIDDSLTSDLNLDQKIKELSVAKKINILYMSRVEVEKGVYNVIDAIKILSKMGFSIKLYIAGDGTELVKTQEYVNNRPYLKDHISFLGYIKNKRKKEILTESHIFCLPSYTEGFPVSLLEAMAFGLAIVTTPVGGIADFFQDGRMGYLCRVNNTNDIVESVINLINNREKMIKILRYNYTLISKEYLSSSLTEKIDRIYKSTF